METNHDASGVSVASAVYSVRADTLTFDVGAKSGLLTLAANGEHDGSLRLNTTGHDSDEHALVKRGYVDLLEERVSVLVGSANMDDVVRLTKVAETFAAEDEKLQGFITENCASIDALQTFESATNQRLHEFSADLTALRQVDGEIDDHITGLNVFRETTERDIDHITKLIRGDAGASSSGIIAELRDASENIISCTNHIQALEETVGGIQGDIDVLQNPTAFIASESVLAPEITASVCVNAQDLNVVHAISAKSLDVDDKLRVDGTGVNISGHCCLPATVCQLSDARVKDIEWMENAVCLQGILAIQPCSYVFKSNFASLSGGRTHRAHMGVEAQQVEAVFPLAVQHAITDTVGTDGEVINDLKSVDYLSLIGPLIGAIKALTERVEQLENCKH